MSTHPIPLCLACHCRLTTEPSAHNPHSFYCTEQTSEQILKRLIHAHASALERLDRIWDLNKEVARWQGKFNTLRLENNALRRRLRKYPAIAPGHNPENLTPKQVGEGWRLLQWDEDIPGDGQLWDELGKIWTHSLLQGYHRDRTDLGAIYRTRTPLPK